jgi:hypothetical protein
MVLVVLGSMSAFFMLLGLVLISIGLDRNSKCLLCLWIAPGPSVFIGCIVCSPMVAYATIDPRPRDFFILESHNYFNDPDLAAYVRLFRHIQLRARTLDRPSDRPRAIQGWFDDRPNSTIREVCFLQLTPEWRLSAPSYPVALPRNFSEPFLLSRNAEPAPDLIENLETGHGDWYPTSGDRERYDLMWDIWDLPGHFLPYFGTEGNDPSDGCSVNLDTYAAYDGVAPGLEAADIEDWACSTFKACVAQAERDRTEFAARRKRLAKLGVRRQDFVTSTGVVMPDAWVLPAGWDNFAAVKDYYRESAFARLDAAVSFDPLSIFAFNVCFLAVGCVGWLMVVAGAVKALCGDKWVS